MAKGCKICGRASAKAEDYKEDFFDDWDSVLDFFCDHHLSHLRSRLSDDTVLRPLKDGWYIQQVKKYPTRAYCCIESYYDCINYLEPDETIEDCERFFVNRFPMPNEWDVANYLTWCLERMAGHITKGFPPHECEERYCASLAKEVRDGHYVCGKHTERNSRYCGFYGYKDEPIVSKPDPIMVGKIVLDQWLKEAKLNEQQTTSNTQHERNGQDKRRAA